MSSFDHDHDARHLDWEGCPNARDLGGFPTRSGRPTRWAAIVRSDSPHRLSPAGQQSLVDHGIRTIVDLRLPDEAAQASYPFTEPGDHGIAYLNVSFIDPTTFDPAANEKPPERLADDYKGMLAHHQSQVASAMHAIADAAEGGVLVHCAGGRDRTGLLSALLLDLVGVPRQLIAEDYGLSSERLRERNDAWAAEAPDQQAERREAIIRWWTHPEIMDEVLTFLDKEYGGTEAYLRAAGVTEEELDRIRERLRG